jgi:hypothetical protein
MAGRMSGIPLRIQLGLDEADLSLFDGADIMLVPHDPAERLKFIKCMAQVEKAIEASGNVEAIQAFQWIGNFVVRAKYTSGAPIKAPGTGRSFDA